MIRKAWNRFRRWLWLGPWILVAVVLAVGIYGYGLQEARLDAALDALGDEQDAAKDRGDEPVAPDPTELLDNPTYEGPSPGPSGPPGDDGADGRGIADTECVDGTWRVEYTDGAVDSDAGDCTGDRGPTGTPGSNGVDGEPGATGPVGPQGSDGRDGSDGRGITNTECDPDTGKWRVEYSDGTVDEDAGSCRPGVGLRPPLRGKPHLVPVVAVQFPDPLSDVLGVFAAVVGEEQRPVHRIRVEHPPFPVVVKQPQPFLRVLDPPAADLAADRLDDRDLPTHVRIRHLFQSTERRSS